MSPLNTLGCEAMHVRRAVSSPPAHQQQGGRSLRRSVTCCLLIRDNDIAAAIRLLSAGLKVQLGSSPQNTGENVKVEMPSSDQRPAESCVMRKNAHLSQWKRAILRDTGCESVTLSSFDLNQGPLLSPIRMCVCSHRLPPGGGRALVFSVIYVFFSTPVDPFHSVCGLKARDMNL